MPKASQKYAVRSNQPRRDNSEQINKLNSQIMFLKKKGEEEKGEHQFIQGIHQAQKQDY